MKYRKLKPLFLSLFLVCFIFLNLSGSVVFSAQMMHPEKPNQFANAFRHRYIIDLTTPQYNPADDNYLQSASMLISQQNRLWNAWKQENCSLDLVGRLFSVTNAMIIETSSQPLLERIQKNPEVKGVYNVNEYYLQRNISVPSILAPEVWKKLDANRFPVMGQSIKIGVIDTGIEYWHGDFGGGIGKKEDGSYYKVIKGYDFAEMNDIPYDSNISFHGTHVSGIIAGYGEAGIASGEEIGKGVAPMASLYSYKVFTHNQKSTGSDAILLALDQAVRDECDIVNLSLGRFFGWSEDYLSLACQKASDLGVLVVASAGNDGEKDNHSNLYPISAPSSGKDVLSVGSIDETIKFGFAFEYQNKQYQYPGKLFQNSPEFDYEPLAVCFFNNEGTEKDYSGKDVTGKIVFVKRGGATFAEKNAIAAKFGAAGLVVYNFTKGWFSGFLPPEQDLIPTMAISLEAGKAFQSILSEQPDLTIRFVPSMKCTVISDFSSEGPTPDKVFKPDLCAPGTNILSASLMGGYTYASGTSMAAPHVSGAAALLKQAYPQYSNEDLRSLLINYSDVVLNPYTLEPYSWFKQGAGKLNVLNSYNGIVTFNPPTLVLPMKESESQEKETSISLQCQNKTTETMSLHWRVEGFYQGKQVPISLSRDSIEIEPSTSISFLTDLIISDQTLGEKKESWLEFNLIGEANGQTKFHVPGIYLVQELPELDPNPISFCFPSLGISPNYDGNSDSNYFYFLSTYLTSGYQVDIWDEEMTKRFGVLDYGQYSNSAGYFQVQVNGEVQGITLKDGFYSIVPYILKKDNLPNNRENWIKGKPARLLIDTVHPTITVSVEYDPVSNTIKASGKLSDDHQEFGLFLMYELDYDEADLVDVNTDGTFSLEIQPESEYGFIAFTVQDIAGNTYRIKKRLD